MLTMPEIERRHVLAFARSRNDLMPAIVGSGRIVDEYRFDDEAEAQPYVAVVECRDPETAKTVSLRLAHGSRGVFSHSEAISHAFTLGAKTPAAFR